jgi:hypothetical protein
MGQLEDEAVEASEKAGKLFKIESRPHATAVERDACTCGLPRPGGMSSGVTMILNTCGWGESETGFQFEVEPRTS